MTGHADKVRLEVDASDVANILANHSGQGGVTTGWVGETGVTLAAVTNPVRSGETLAGSYTGGKTIRATHTGVGNARVLSPAVAVAGGAQVGGWFSVADSRVVVPGNELIPYGGFLFYDAASALVGSWGFWFYRKFEGGDAPWRMVEFDGGSTTVPAGATSARMWWLFRDGFPGLAAISRDVYLSKVMIVTSSGPDASTKVAGVPFAEGTVWQNVLGSATSAKITRGGRVNGAVDEIEPGTLTATVTDPVVDPAQNPRMRRGRKVRFTALDPTSATWRPLFTGRVEELDVVYADKYNPKATPRVTVTAVDAAAELAKTPQPFNYSGAYGPKVKALLAGSSIPYVADAGSASTDINHRDRDQGQLWDQLVLARNTFSGGRLWVDAAGVLQARTVTPTGVAVHQFHDRLRRAFTNLVLNPSYEVNTLGASKTTTPTSFSRSTVWGERGSASLLMIATSATADAGLRQATAAGSQTQINLTPGDYFSARVAVKAAKANMTFQFQIFEFVGGSAVGSAWYAGTVSTVAVGDVAVVEMVHKQTVAPNADSVRIYLLSAFASTTGDLFYADGWSVINEGATAAGWETVPYADTTGVWEPVGTPYVDVDVNHGAGVLVNEVSVVANNDGELDGAKEYGPYRNALSQSNWGVAPAQVQAVDPADPSLLAKSYLERFADPITFPRSVTFRAEDADPAAWFLDLYNECRVVHGPSSTDLTVPVIAVEHVITPKRWDVTVGFRPETSTVVTVANPVAGANTGPDDVAGLSPEGRSREIGNAEDLDTYTKPGAYHQSQTAEAVTGSNYPVPQAGLLEVELSDNENFCYQRYTVYNGSSFAGETFTRSRYNGTWSAWKIIGRDMWSGEAVCSTALTTTTGAADVAGATLSVPVADPSEVFMVNVSFEVQTLLTTKGTFTGRLVVDGVSQSAQCVWVAPNVVGERNTLTRRYRITGLAAGTRVFKLQGAGSVASNYRVNTTHSTITVEQRS